MPNPIKVLYKANLKLKTALHIGCAQESPLAVSEMMQNGAGEYIIPGTSLAGVFCETLRNIIGLEEDDKENNSKKWKLYTTISETLIKTKDGGYQNRGSALAFRAINLGEKPPKQIRNRTGIDRKTKTAKEGHQFSYWEIEPEDVSLKVKIEIDNLSFKKANLDIEKLQKWVKMVFASWKKEGVFFGAHNTSGNGYCKLKNAEEYIIKSEDDFYNYIDDKVEYEPIRNFPKYRNKRFKTWKITLEMGDEANDYGTNALLIKGGVSHRSLADNSSKGIFINTGKRLFIPGSSLKGTFSMFLEKYGYKNKYLHKYFGQEDEDGKASKYQGYIYFPDLIFAEKYNDHKKHLINIERHTEDEFTRAIYKTGKFNEERLFYAKAKGKIKVPMKFYKKYKNNLDGKKGIDDMFKFMKQGCEKRLIPLGANGCYPIIKIEEENNGN